MFLKAYDRSRAERHGTQWPEKIPRKLGQFAKPQRWFKDRVSQECSNKTNTFSLIGSYTKTCTNTALQNPNPDGLQHYTKATPNVPSSFVFYKV